MLATSHSCSRDALKAGGYLEEGHSSVGRTQLSGLGLACVTVYTTMFYEDLLPESLLLEDLQNSTIDELRTTQGMALSTLVRMLFISYAEDRDLLPLHRERRLSRNVTQEISIEFLT